MDKTKTSSAVSHSNDRNESLQEHLSGAKVKPETVLVMQGGGSLGAYECGVYKALERHGIKFDIIAGTSIGAINAGIIVGSKGDKPSETLESFWLDISEKVTPSVFPTLLRSISSSMYGAIYGNPKVFSPRWRSLFPFNAMQNNNDFLSSPFSWFSSLSCLFQEDFYKWPYLYDIKPLKKTLHRYIDFSKINKQNSLRLILTCTDIQQSQPVIFDSKHSTIDADHLLACAGFPFYGIAWTKKDGKYLWDGSLLSNTPLREVIDASPMNDKIVYIVNLFPHLQKELPENMFDSWHRARDIMYSDRTDHNVRMSKVISRHLSLLKEMHDFLIRNTEPTDRKNEIFKQIEREYHKLAEARGTMIKEITKIERTEDVHFIFEDADFSMTTISGLIRQGEKDAERALTEKKSPQQ